MLIGLTGTPGTGKTSVSKLLEKKRQWKVIHLNDLIKEEHLYTEVDEKRDAVVADMELVRSRLPELTDEMEKESARITSYNVCYTKLLRLPLRLPIPFPFHR